MKPDQPQRSCLGCRETHDKRQLLRFVLAPDNAVVPDLESKLPGRGAYVCNRADCLTRAIRQRQFSRAFKKDVSVCQPEILIEQITSIMRKRALAYVGLANKAGRIVSGSSQVGDLMRGGRKPGLVLLAEDVSDGIGEKVMTLAGVHRVPLERIFSKEDFGAILGKAPRSTVAVQAGGFVTQIRNEINRYRNFLGEVRSI